MMHSTTYLINGISSNSGLSLVLSHGLQSSVSSPFMEHLTDGLAAYGFKIVRFNFPFMEENKTNGTPIYLTDTLHLEQYWKKVITELGNPEKLVIGGKSIAGFAATKVADALGVRGVAAMEFPFISPDSDLKLELSHLKKLKTPTIIIQGSETPSGTPAQINEAQHSHSVSMHWLANAGHNFKPSPQCKKSHDENMLEAMECIAEFMDFLDA